MLCCIIRIEKGIIRVGKEDLPTHCYRITEKGHNTIAMALKLRQTNVLELKLAA